MIEKQLRPAPPCQAATGPEMLRMPTLSVPEYSVATSLLQVGFLASRFGLSAERARVVAELAWGRL